MSPVLETCRTRPAERHKMTIELTGAEAQIIDAGLAERAESFAKLARLFRNRRGRFLDSVKRRMELAEGVRRKLLVAQYGETRAAEIVAERAKEPDAEELADGEPVRREGVTCYGTADTIPYCNGVDCPDWRDCHGDKLRGYSESASNWRGAMGL